ncbi:hypothetical protein PG997_006854 [Apiospora hydei]|uniref:Uncharacterized protein n=1 Tax=Apiospora hydei TaxID=1337664 RepID=A0ABR1WQ85_9PEZI
MEARHQPHHVIHDALHPLDEPDLLVLETDDHGVVLRHRAADDWQAVGEPRRPLDQLVRARLERGRAPPHAPPKVGERLGFRARGGGSGEVRRVGRAQGRVGGGDRINKGRDAGESLGLRHVKGVELRLRR